MPGVSDQVDLEWLAPVHVQPMGVPVAKMNWEKASAEYRYAKAVDYSTRMDEEEQVPLHLLERGRLKPDADDQKEPPRRKKKSKKKGKKRFPGPSDGRPEIIKVVRKVRPKGARGKSIADAIKTEATRSGRTVAEVSAARMQPAALQPHPVSSPPRKVIVSSGKGKPPPRPTPAPRSRRVPAPAQPPPRMTKEAKVERDLAEAKRRGITLDHLKAERRQIGKENLVLHQEAVRLGTTVKKLRSRGQQPGSEGSVSEE